MSRSRVYTRKELETLRRADLQNLFKIHGLRGANQRTDTLIDGLETFFVTNVAPPAAGSPARQRPTTATSVRQLKPIGEQPSRGGKAVPPKRRPVPPAPLSRAAGGRSADGTTEATRVPNVSTSTSVPTLHDKLSVLSDRVASLDQRLSEPSSSGLASDVAKLKEEVERLSNELKESKEASSEDVRTALKERDETWSSKLEAVETGWKSRMAEMEARWEGRLVKLEMQRGRSTEPAPRLPGTSSSALGKRREREDDSDEHTGPPPFLAPPDFASPTKKPRTVSGSSIPDHSSIRERIQAAARRSASPTKSPRTPSPTKGNSRDIVFKTPELPASVMKRGVGVSTGPSTGTGTTAGAAALGFTMEREPRTPSPGHQGHLPDNSATPAAISTDYFSGLPPPIQRRGSEGEELPFPLFATTPRPAMSAPKSPTLDAPPSASRARLNASNTPHTPLRRPSDKMNKVSMSKAHMELMNLTGGDSDDDESATPIARAPVLGLGKGVAASTSTGEATGEGAQSDIARAGNIVPFPLNATATTTITTAMRSSSSEGRTGSASASAETIVTPIHIPPLLAVDLSDDGPRLSPSPSITETRFSTVPFPFPSKNRSASAATTASSVSATGTELGLGPERSSRSRSIRSSSPSREYMDVALNGLDPSDRGHNLHGLGMGTGMGSSDQSPDDYPGSSAYGDEGRNLVTPAPHRTLLGTERYRDERYGDMPMIQWGTPTVDLDLGSTPRR